MDLKPLSAYVFKQLLFLLVLVLLQHIAPKRWSQKSCEDLHNANKIQQELQKLKLEPHSPTQLQHGLQPVSL